MDFGELLRLETWGNASVCGCPEARWLRHQHKHPLGWCSAAEDRQMTSGGEALLSSMELTKGHSPHDSSKKPKPQTGLWRWCSDTDLWKVCIRTVANFGSGPPENIWSHVLGPVCIWSLSVDADRVSSVNLLGWKYTTVITRNPLCLLAYPASLWALCAEIRP